MSFDEALIQQVWDKGRALSELDGSKWRMDACGAWMFREHYGHEHSEFGWQIEKVSAGGDDSPEHLRPFHSGNHYNQAAAQAHCKVTADREDIQPTARIDTPRNRTL